jgi:peptidyl-prolyl cis-trans isomerase B (cyclophilin B)
MDSASSQFFITTADAVSLDGKYAAFGYITEGMDVVDQIASVPAELSYDGTGRPYEPVVIESIKVIS